jgi:hypothetical protein
MCAAHARQNTGPNPAPRAVASILLLCALLVGIFSPVGMCSLMCEHQLRADLQRHCNQEPGAMPGMAHHRSSSTHPSIDAVSQLLQSGSCCQDCATSEGLYLAVKTVPQTRVFRTGVERLNATAKSLARGTIAAWSSDSDPPTPPDSHATAFSVLRI